MSELVSYFKTQQDAMVRLLTDLVCLESFTQSKTDVDRLGDFMAEQYRVLGATVERIPQTEVGDYVLAKWNTDAPGKPIMFLTHIDTVWPIGTLAERPVRIDDEGRLFGPGAIDMKGGITVMLSALRGLRELGLFPDRPIWALTTSDEEVGSVYSEEIIKALATQVGLVLVMEPATIDESLKTSRKGVANFRIDVEGRPAHAGNAPEKGINAIVELAHQTLALQKLNDLKHGTSVSVTMVSGGSATNVIPASATAHVDVRVLTEFAYDELREKIMALQPHVPGAKLTITPGHMRGPMERNARMNRDYEQVKAIGGRHGLHISEDSSGGGSDGNFTAMLGISTLDGMGPQGDGLHALNEHVVLSSLPRRSALVAALLREWEFA